MSQLTADNAQWEDRQLLRSGAVRGTEVQTEFDDEEERKVILLVHGKKTYNMPPQLVDGLNVTLLFRESVSSSAAGIIEKRYVYLL